MNLYNLVSSSEIECSMKRSSSAPALSGDVIDLQARRIQKLANDSSSLPAQKQRPDDRVSRPIQDPSQALEGLEASVHRVLSRRLAIIEDLLKTAHTSARARVIPFRTTEE